MELARRCHAKEDMRLVAGKGNYAGDNFPDNLCHAVILRSPHAHAHIRGIDVSAAKSAPGVLTVLTGKDASADGIGAIPHSPDWQGHQTRNFGCPKGLRFI